MAVTLDKSSTTLPGMGKSGNLPNGPPPGHLGFTIGMVGFNVGFNVGFTVGATVGATVGSIVGAIVGAIVGVTVGVCGLGGGNMMY
jgi:tetrahydromethanopterin S-methyltransferase subunit C